MSGSAGPIFSVIMPCYNHEAYVAEAIQSVRAQTWPHWRLWVVDDGSTDSSWQIVQGLAQQDERIQAVRQENAGPAAARNHGVAMSYGKWLAFLDSDDVYYPTALAEFAEFIADNPEADFIYGYRHRLNVDGSVTKLAGEYQDHVTGAPELFGRMYLSHLCLCYRRRLWEMVKGYDERLRSVEDYDLYLRMSLHTKFHPLGKATGLRRRHGKNLSRQSGYSRSLQAAVLKRFLDRYGGKNLIPPELIAKRMHKIYYSAGRQYFKQRYFLQSSLALQNASRYEFGFRTAALRWLAGLLVFAGRVDKRELPPF